MQAKGTNSLLGFGVRPSEGQTVGQTGNQRFWAGLVAVLVAVGVYAFANANETRMGLFWVLGLGFGAVLQRSHLCFASAAICVLPAPSGIRSCWGRGATSKASLSAWPLPLPASPP